jgi:ferritin-like metal-binding protein YciE
MTPISEQNPEDVKFENVHLKRIFLEHLNSIYFGKKHLIDFFEEIKELASLTYLKEAVQECYEATQKQLVQLDSIYNTIDETPSKTTVLGIKAMTLEAYISAIKTGKTAMERDVFIVFYVQIIEGIEITYFDVLRNLAKAIGYSNTFINKPFNLAVENKLAFEAIYKAYITEPT